MLNRIKRQQLIGDYIKSPNNSTINVQVIKPDTLHDSSSPDRRTTRGRQISKQNKIKSTSKMIGGKIKTKIANRKTLLSDDDENDSSDSDFSRKKRHPTQEEEIGFPFCEELDISDDEIKQELSSDLHFHYEDNLNNEIERILIDIYNSHITTNKKKKLNIAKYEKHIKFFSQTLNEQYNIFILQILSEKIKELIRRYKEKILEIPEIKQIHVEFLEMKKKFHMIGKKMSQITQMNVQIFAKQTSTMIEQQSELNNAKNKMELNDTCYKSVTRILLLELRNIKRSLIRSSPDIEKVFQFPLNHLKTKGRMANFSIEDMHREEFLSTLVEDEFISTLILQIKTISRQLNIEEINQLINQIEGDHPLKTKEMTRFTNFLNKQLKLYFEAEEQRYNDADVSERSSDEEAKKIFNCDAKEAKAKGALINDEDKGNTSKPPSNNVNKSIFSKIDNKVLTPMPILAPTVTPTSTTSASSGTSQQKELKPADVDIDELVKFIVTDEVKPKKTAKKKNKKKKANDESNTQAVKEESYDKEIELFRQALLQSSFKAYSMRKIKPKFTEEWIKNISLLVAIK